MDDHDDDDEGPPGQGPPADSAVDSASEGHSKSSQNFAWPQDYRTPSLLSLLLFIGLAGFIHCGRKQFIMQNR